MQTRASKLSPELSDLVFYTRSVPFRSFEQAAKNPETDLSSFSESEALRLIKDSGMKVPGPGQQDGNYCRFGLWLSRNI